MNDVTPSILQIFWFCKIIVLFFIFSLYLNGFLTYKRQKLIFSGNYKTIFFFNNSSRLSFFFIVDDNYMRAFIHLLCKRKKEITDIKGKIKILTYFYEFTNILFNTYTSCFYYCLCLKKDKCVFFLTRLHIFERIKAVNSLILGDKCSLMSILLWRLSIPIF